jgi:hypothetical protein
VNEILKGHVARIREGKYIQKLKPAIEKVKRSLWKNKHEMDRNISLDFKGIEKYWK